MNGSTFADALRQQLQDRLVRRALVIAALAGAVLFLGLVYYYQHNTYGGQSLNANYGRRSGNGAESVNGTSVLAQMFQLNGFRVRTANRLTPKLRKTADVIVWAPDNFQPPTKKQREFLEQWLADGDSRTLIYIGRDYDAAADYWKAVQPAASPEDAKRMAELAAAAEELHDLGRTTMPQSAYARWFTVRSGEKKETIGELSGPWAEGVDASGARIVVRGRLDVPLENDAQKDDPAPPGQIETLLAGDGRDLVFRLHDFAWLDGQILVVTNGSFLLNYPLVHREHRKLAARLIDECSGRDAVFLESDSDGPEVLEQDPPETGGLAMLRIWPLNAIAIHMTVFGIVLCLARWPIFGRPKTLPGENPSDFGRHVTSLGRLLARTKNVAYAQSRLAQYHQQSRRGSGTSHRK